jgi:hypothetical protein
VQCPDLLLSCDHFCLSRIALTVVCPGPIAFPRIPHGIQRQTWRDAHPHRKSTDLVLCCFLTGSNVMCAVVHVVLQLGIFRTVGDSVPFVDCDGRSFRSSRKESSLICFIQIIPLTVLAMMSEFIFSIIDCQSQNRLASRTTGTVN